MIRLFDETSHYTDEANKLENELGEVMAPILKKWYDAGYCPRDITYVATGLVNEEVINMMLGWGYLAIKKEEDNAG